MFLSPQIQIKYFFTNYLLINLSTQKLHMFCSDKVVPINLFLYLRYKVLYSRYRDLFQTPLLRKHDCAEAFCPHFRFKQETLAESPNPGRQYLHLEHKRKVLAKKKMAPVRKYSIPETETNVQRAFAYCAGQDITFVPQTTNNGTTVL